MSPFIFIEFSVFYSPLNLNGWQFDSSLHPFRFCSLLIKRSYRRIRNRVLYLSPSAPIINYWETWPWHPVSPDDNLKHPLVDQQFNTLFLPLSWCFLLIERMHWTCHNREPCNSLYSQHRLPRASTMKLSLTLTQIVLFRSPISFLEWNHAIDSRIYRIAWTN